MYVFQNQNARFGRIEGQLEFESFKFKLNPIGEIEEKKLLKKLKYSSRLLSKLFIFLKNPIFQHSTPILTYKLLFI